MNKKVYFLSDVHLDSKSHTDSIEVERKLCRWLDMARQDAQAIYLLGDIFDFWYEYKYVVPKGFVRLLGKLAEITDSGIEVHFFIGNHDIWLTDYLAKECGLILHFKPEIIKINDKKIFLAHGDGLNETSIPLMMFRSKFLRACLSTIHPRWTIPLAHKWSNYSRKNGDTQDYLGEDKENLIIFAKQKLKEIPDINYFIFGHRHILLDLPIAETSRVIIIGDWISYFSYAVLEDDVRLEKF
ncbi:MAG: UDP-2,3-diacylglucosamine diphosphatase [Dysgonamonadaceae bacterium]|jgi:UDP-2,3-diacylglucosamine hydrolase|nr:UDP-2,3-diacylglucosamine diphosphatase [Dysgonamonadaceae bacterium]